MNFETFLKDNHFPSWEVEQSAEAVSAALSTGRKLVKVHHSLFQTGMEEIKWEPILDPTQLWMRASEHLEFADCAPLEGRSYPQGRLLSL